MSIADDFAFYVATCRLELPRIADDLRWAHANGYWPSGRWIDSERGVDLSRSEDERLDAAPLLDIGIGDHASRQAFLAAPSALDRADIHLAAALTLAGRRRQPTLSRPARTSSLAFLLSTVHVCTWRAVALAKVHDPARDSLRQVRKAAGVLERLHSSFVAVLGRGAPPSPPVGKQCRICRLRPKVDKAGGRCNTCATYFHRNRKERPRSLDDDIRVEPHIRQAARLKRGEGFGEA